MNYRVLFSFCILFIFACKLMPKNEEIKDSPEFAAMLENYFTERMKLFPLEATQNGDTLYNDLLPADFTDSYRDALKAFFTRQKTALGNIPRRMLSQGDRLSYDVFKREISMSLERLSFPENYFPFNQFEGLPLTLGTFGSGEGAQPFRTEKDYKNWIARAMAFGPWADSAITYFRKGMAAGYVLPKSLVVKIIPQLDAMETGDVTKSLFYGPVQKFPPAIDSAQQSSLRTDLSRVITQNLLPAYKRLADFMKKEYLAAARSSSGISAIPGGAAYYAFLVREETTTTQSPEEIYQTGLHEVARIRSLMDSIKNAVQFHGDLHAFFAYLQEDKKFMPFKTPADVLAAYEQIHQRMQPHLSTMFNHVPKTKFEIRQTEAFRAESASAEYFQGTIDGSRPGIFYVPILDATKFNTTSGMESLFLHEAIPGHHYQISLTMEDTLLPKFRRYGGNDAYVEGWALYCESLGKELGLYTDPYQYLGALGDEMHRAVRLVVDVAIHIKGMTREEAIKYMMENEPISEQGATAEIERYMAIPGQALAYKIGALKIRDLRDKYAKDLGEKFTLAAFHDEILKDGPLPLDVLERKMDRWANALK
jgi:uncharacterized protein (DUF885 family)